MTTLWPMRRARLAAAALIASMAAACPTLAAVSETVIVSDGRAFPESVTSTVGGDLIFGSIATGTIYRARSGVAIAEPWIDGAAAQLGLVLGVLADDAHDLLWVCSSARESGSPSDKSTGVKVFRLSDGTAIGNYVFPDGKGVCNDMAVGADSALYATDTPGARVLRLTDGDTRFTEWAADQLLAGADGIAVAGDGALYVNSISSGALLRLVPTADGTAATVVPIKLSRPLEKPDGMRPAPDGSLLVAEQAGRLSRIEVAGDRAVVGTLAEGLDEPAAVTVVGRRAYVLLARLSYSRRPELKDTDPGPVRALPIALDFLLEDSSR